MKFSTLPFLLVAVFGFIAAITYRSVRLSYLESRNAKKVYWLLIILGIWTVISSILAIKGVYTSSRFYALLPGLWFPIIPVSICLIPFLISSQFQNTLTKILNCTPIHWLIYLQALRIAAMGTLYKTLIGQFPLAVELAMGISDLIFGFSALYIAKRVSQNNIGWKGLAIWNLVGIGIIMPIGEIAIQTALPGILQVFSAPPTAEVIFEFPLVLAPTVVVPLLVVINGLVAWWLYKTQPISFSQEKGTTVWLDYPIAEQNTAKGEK